MTPDNTTSAQIPFGFVNEALLANMAGESHMRSLDEIMNDIQARNGTSEEARRAFGKYIEEQIQIAEQQAGLKYRTLEMTADRLLSDSRWRRIAGLQYDIATEAISLLKMALGGPEVKELIRRSAELNHLSCTAEECIPDLQLCVDISLPGVRRVLATIEGTA